MENTGHIFEMSGMSGRKIHGYSRQLVVKKTKNSLLNREFLLFWMVPVVFLGGLGWIWPQKKKSELKKSKFLD